MLHSIQDLIERLKEARVQKKMSQEELATQINVPQSHISKIEKGKVNIKLASFIEMARTLELEVMLIPKEKVIWIKHLLQHGLDEEDKNIRAYIPDSNNEDEDENE